MTTVFICMDWFHPAYKAGGPVQSIANLVEQYRQEQVCFKIFCSNTDLDGSVNQGVVFDEWCYYNASTQVWYASASSKRVAVIKREVKKSGAAILFIIGIYSWYFNLVPLLFCKAPVKIISARGMLHPGGLTQKSFKKKVFLALWKLAGIPARNYFHATDEQEQGFIHNIFGGQAKVFIAGNFSRSFAMQAATGKAAGILHLASIAVIGAMKNIALVLQALRQCNHHIYYHIYGPVKEEAYWQQCLAAIKMLPANISVSYQGDVAPEKIEATLRGCEVFILPSKSENFGHAIFEALSAGKPVITSHYTPFNNLFNQHAGQNIAVENVKEVAVAIDYFAAMPAGTFAEWNIGASNYAERNTNKKLLIRQYDEMFLGAMGNKQ